MKQTCLQTNGVRQWTPGRIHETKQAQVKEKKEAPLDSKQAGWCNYQNFQLIKNEV